MNDKNKGLFLLTQLLSTTSSLKTHSYFINRWMGKGRACIIGGKYRKGGGGRAGKPGITLDACIHWV